MPLNEEAASRDGADPTPARPVPGPPRVPVPGPPHGQPTRYPGGGADEGIDREVSAAADGWAPADATIAAERPIQPARSADEANSEWAENDEWAENPDAIEAGDQSSAIPELTSPELTSPESESGPGEMPDAGTDAVPGTADRTVRPSAVEVPSTPATSSRFAHRLAEIDDLRARPLAEHAEAYLQLHSELQAALAEIDGA